MRILFAALLLAQPGTTNLHPDDTRSEGAARVVRTVPPTGLGDRSTAVRGADFADPAFYYFVNGLIPGGRTFTVGDNKAWGIPVEDLQGRSAGGKLKIESADYKATGDALRAVWSKARLKGELSLTGPPIDISGLKDVAALTFDIKVDQKPTQEVYLALDCGWPCRGEVKIGNLLRKYKRGDWHSFPLPLSCFKGNQVNLAEVIGVFLLTTEGRLSVSIANIRLERLSDSDRGCKS